MRIVLLIFLSGCAGAIVAVGPGHGAVVTDASGAMRVIGEGESDIADGARVDDFDLRQSEHTATFNALSADGVPVVARAATIDYQLAPGELIDFDRQVGPSAEAIVTAVVAAAVAAVLATYRWDALDTAHVREAQAKIVALAAKDLRSYHLLLGGVDLKGLLANLPSFNQAVTRTAAWEQKSIEAKTKIDLARQHADAQRTQAAGIAAANNAIAGTLTAATLRQAHNTAWKRLITASTTTVDVATSPLVEVDP